MVENKKKTFPTIPAKQWWALREKFKRSIPAAVDPTYLASALEMTELAAKTNVAPALRATGIIDEDGKPTDRAVAWRDDVSYPKVCAEIIAEVYPQAIRDLVTDHKNDRDAARRWFANTTGAGQNAVGKMTSLFLMLVEADPQRGKSGGRPKKTATNAAPRKPQVKKPKQSEVVADRAAEPRSRQVSRPGNQSALPSIHLNIQVLSSPEATPEQIDAVFESMARHLSAMKA